MGISNRIRQYAEFRGLTIAELERRCKLSNGAVAKMGECTRRSTIDRISTVFPDINEVWLITGQGEMLKRPAAASVGNGATAIGDNAIAGAVIHSGNEKGGTSNAVLQERVKSLEKLLAEKERLIQVLLKVKTLDENQAPTNYNIE